MKNQPIRIMIVFAVASMVSLIVIQMFWVSQVAREQEEDFNHRVRMSLRSVAESLCQISGTDLVERNAIDQLTPNYFVVRTEQNIQVANLEYLLQSAFSRREIQDPFEYGIYSCENDRMVHGRTLTASLAQPMPRAKWPKLKRDEYYFGVYFPNKNHWVDLNLWKYATAATLLLAGFFSYGLVVVLKQKRLSEVQEEFIDNVSHELRTPISTLKLAAQQVEKKGTEDMAPYTRILQQETQRLEQHVDQILYSTQQNKKIDWEEVSPSELLWDLLEEQQSMHPDIDWQLQIPKNLPTVGSQSNLLRTALRNLLENAVKYGEGVVMLGVRAEQHLTIDIQDNGPGIPKKYRKRIFDKFFRVPTDNLHDVKGHGLGMFIVAQHVKAIGGTIRLRDSDRGAHFQLKLPI